LSYVFFCFHITCILPLSLVEMLIENDSLLVLNCWGGLPLLIGQRHPRTPGPQFATYVKSCKLLWFSLLWGAVACWAVAHLFLATVFGLWVLFRSVPKWYGRARPRCRFTRHGVTRRARALRFSNPFQVGETCLGAWH